MDKKWRPSNDNQLSALEGVFTNYISLQAIASAIQWQPASIFKSLDQLSIHQTPIHDDLTNNQNRADLCHAVQNIVALIVRLSKNIAQLDAASYDHHGQTQTDAAQSQSDRTNSQCSKDKNLPLFEQQLASVSAKISGPSADQFSLLWQLKQIRQALVKRLKQRDIEDQLFFNPSVDEQNFPPHIQQLGRQIVHTHVTLKALLQQQACILVQNRPMAQLAPLSLDHALIANPDHHPIVVSVCIRQTTSHPLQGSWLRALAQKREKIKITFKKHEMRLRHLTAAEIRKAKLISLLCQTELFRLILKESIGNIDRVILDAEELCGQLETLCASAAATQTTQTTHASPTEKPSARFTESLSALCQQSRSLNQQATELLHLMRQLTNTDIIPFKHTPERQSSTTEA